MPPRELKTMLMQTFAVTNKEHYAMLWFILEWSISCSVFATEVPLTSLPG